MAYFDRTMNGRGTFSVPVVQTMARRARTRILDGTTASWTLILLSFVYLVWHVARV